MKYLWLISISFTILSSVLTQYSSYNSPFGYNSNNNVGGGGSMSSFYEPITIGLLTDRQHEEMGIVADMAIENANLWLDNKLVLVKDQLPFGNSFYGYGKLCRMMEAGVGAVFGPSSRHTAAHLSSICDAKDMPYFFPSISDAVDAFNLYPHPEHIAKALYSLLVAFDWSRFIFLYESAEYLNIFNYLMQQYDTKDIPIITVLRYDADLDGNYKPILKRVRKEDDKKIVVVGSTESIPEFLKQAQQVGIFTEDFRYIFGNLDFHSFDLEEFKYSEANITSFRMFSPENPQVKAIMQRLGYNRDMMSNDNDPSKQNFDKEKTQNGTCPITMEMALTYDAIQLFAATSKEIPIRPTPLNCTDRSDSVKDDGSTFKNYMRTMTISKDTLTGLIAFDSNVRKGFNFDVVELQPSGIVQVGTWDEVNNFTSLRVAKTNTIFENISLANKTFKILLSIPNKPYASIKDSHKKLEGNEQYEGYGVELIQRLAEKLGFNYTFENGGNDYGTFNRTSNSTTGMLKKLIDLEADLAVTDLTITSERQEAIDFTIPFMNLGIGILFLRPKKANTSKFSFLEPFNVDVWLNLGLSFLGVSLSFFILGRLSPVEWDNPCACIEEPSELENQFTLSNSIWFTTGSLLQQGSEVAPKALSVRTVASIWLFFTLIMVSSYTANLAAFLTIETPQVLIENVKDLAENKGGVVYGAKRTGSTKTFFATSEDPVYKKMNDFLNANTDYLTESNQEGVDRVKNNENYAFLMETTSIEYNTVRECSLKKIGGNLDEKGYGIAMRKNWEFSDEFNNALLELLEQGSLTEMYRKWWIETGGGTCASKTEASEANPLTMENLGGIYIVLVVGSGMALIHAIISWICFIFRKARRHKVSFREAFKEELKFVMEFTVYTRDLKAAASIYTPSRKSSMTVEKLELDSSLDKQ